MDEVKIEKNDDETYSAYFFEACVYTGKTIEECERESANDLWQIVAVRKAGKPFLKGKKKGKE